MTIPWIYPSPSHSHHHGYYFLVGNPYKSLFATVNGWGVDPRYDVDINHKSKVLQGVL